MRWGEFLTLKREHRLRKHYRGARILLSVYQAPCFAGTETRDCHASTLFISISTILPMLFMRVSIVLQTLPTSGDVDCV